MTETQEITCARCGAKMRVHVPLVAMAHDARMSQVAVIPSWSLDERKCSNCGTLNAPMIMSIKTEWVGFDDPEQKRVQAATAADLKNLGVIQ